MRRVIKIPFLKAFTEDSLPPICSKVAYKQTFYNNTNTDSNSDFKKQVFLFKDVSDYLDIEFLKHSKNIVINKVITIKGYIIELNLFSNLAEYLETNFNSKSRSNLRRYKKRLEKCFNISYVSYYGNIPVNEYDRLFIILKKILIRRFNEKKENNYELQYLKDYKDILYNMILEKQACLFVIYDGDKPISIRINMRKKNIIYYVLSGYDIDYSKFHLGFIDMLKNIEWCINNKFEVYDLLKGYGYYKTKWSTKTHNYYNYIIYNSNSLITSIIGQCITFKEIVKYKGYWFLKNYNLDANYKTIKRYVFSIRNLNKKEKNHTIQLANSTKNSNQFTKISIENSNEYAFLRKPVYDLLFFNNESINNTVVSKLTGSNNIFKVEFKNEYKLLKIEK